MRRMHGRAWAAAAAVSLLPLATVRALAHEPTPQFPSDTEVVLLDMVARGKKDRPVLDLEANDIRVYENDKRCNIVSFRLVRAGTAELEAAEADSAGVGGHTARVPARAGLVVLLFDRLTTLTAPLARDGALDLLSQEFPPDTWFAVAKIAYGGTRQIQGFTTDRERLSTAVLAATVGDTDERGTEGAFVPTLPALDDAPPVGAPGTPPQDLFPDLRAAGAFTYAPMTPGGEVLAGVRGLDTLYPVLGITRALAPVKGRKAIVYFGETWQFPTWVDDVYSTVISAANRGNTTIHTVDARGLRPDSIGRVSTFDAVHSGLSAESRASGGPTRSHLAASLNAGEESGTPMSWGIEGVGNRLAGPRIESLAEDTGGLAIANTNDLGVGLKQAIEELGNYYEVVYAPPNAVQDGKFRRIRVDVDRRGVKVRSRAGYFASAESAPTVFAYELPLIAALDAETAMQDFPLETGALYFSSRNGERDSIILAEVPLTGIRLEAAEGGEAKGHLTLLAHLKDEKGRLVARLSHDWPIQGAPATSAVFKSRLPLAPGHYTLETAVQDRNSSQTSVTTTKLDVPKAARGLVLGSVAVLRRVEASDDDAATDDPLRIGEVAVFPSLRPRFVAGMGGELPLYVPVFPEKPAEAIELTVELRRAGQLLTTSTTDAPKPDPDGRVAWIGGVPLEGLEPGSYEVTVRARQGRSRDEQRVSFELTAAPALPPASPPT